MVEHEHGQEVKESEEGAKQLNEKATHETGRNI
jgi:hypothetical protein